MNHAVPEKLKVYNLYLISQEQLINTKKKLEVLLFIVILQYIIRLWELQKQNTLPMNKIR